MDVRSSAGARGRGSKAAHVARRHDRVEPFFAWVHLYDPHAPYEAPEPYRSRFPATAVGRVRRRDRQSTDTQVGRLARRPRRRTAASRTRWWSWWATTARSLGEHGEQTPRLLHLRRGRAHPADRGRRRALPRARRSRTRCGSVDVMPTALDLLGVRRARRPSRARACCPLLRGEAPRASSRHSETGIRATTHGWSELQSIQDGASSTSARRAQTLRPRRATRARRTDLCARSDPSRLAALERALADLIAADHAALPRPRARRASTPRPRSVLAALGYVGGQRQHAAPGGPAARRSQGQDPTSTTS